MRLDATCPPVILGTQLAARSGCDEILLVQEGAPDATAAPSGQGKRPDDGPPLRSFTPSSLGWSDWLERRATRATVIIDLDDIERRRTPGTEHERRQQGVRRMVAAAPFAVVVSQSLSPAALDTHLSYLGIDATFLGSFEHGAGAGSSVAVCEPPASPHRPRTDRPADHQVTAFLTVFNEDDVLDSVLDDLDAQGCNAYVLDNWSTDDSWDIVQHHLGGAVVGAERWPHSGPARYFDLKASLERITELSYQLGSDWYIKHDADELRRPPWPGISLADGLWTAQCAGYNIIDFTVINYPPVDNGFTQGEDLWTYFQYFEFGRKPGHFRQFKAWRNFGQTIEYSRSGSHRMAFPGSRVFPYKFELHHYPIRSQDHGRRKVLRERQGRYLPAARKRGWHSHYDAITEATNFLVDPGTLHERDRQTWNRLVVERLSGAGLPRDVPRSVSSRPGVRPSADRDRWLRPGQRHG